MGKGGGRLGAVVNFPWKNVNCRYTSDALREINLSRVGSAKAVGEEVPEGGTAGSGAAGDRGEKNGCTVGGFRSVQPGGGGNEVCEAV